jgi:hypothetical protein
MSHQWTLEDIPNVTFLQESGDGPTPSGSQDGPTIDLSGQEVAHANLSARQAKEKGLLTSGTYGRPGSGSSASVNLASSLENRLRRRLDSRGSTLFQLTWKARVTLLGRQICARRALALRISDNGYGSWPTPRVQNTRQTQERKDLISQHTPTLFDVYQKSHKDNLEEVVALILSPWPTPAAQEGHRDVTDFQYRNGTRFKSATGSDFGMGLVQAAALTSWPTPSTRDFKDTGNLDKSQVRNDGRNRLDSIPRLAQTGEILNGSPVKTEGQGQLNPDLPRWLMGYPPEWDDCAVTAMQSSRRSQQK